MSSAVILGLVGGLLVVAFLANRVFGLTRIPDVLVLMMLGVLLGPVMGLVQAGTLAKTTNLLGTLAIILVLFEGGLELDLRDTIQHFPGSFLLATLAYIFSTALVSVIAVKGLGLAWTDGLLAGAALGCTSSTVVLPVLKPGLAFAVILITNAMLVLASFRARKSVPAVAATESTEPTGDVPAPPVLAQPGPRRRFVLNAVMLLMLAVGGVVLWYGNHSDQVHSSSVAQWIKTHLHRTQ